MESALVLSKLKNEYEDKIDKKSKVNKIEVVLIKFEKTKNI